MRNTRYAVVPVLAGSLLLAGCGGGSDSSSDSSSSSASNSASAGSSDTASSSASGGSSASAAASCPTKNTRKFAKTRLVADLGLAAGSFHRYIYKPYKANKFQKGAKGRTVAIAKAGATAALDAKLLSNATKNVQANPTLCKKLGAPMSQLSDSLGGLKGQIASGNLAAIASSEGLVQKVLSGAKSNGLNVAEKSN